MERAIKPRGQDGFTLVEMIVCLAILGVLAAAVLPRVQLGEFVLQSAAKNLYTDIREVRMENQKGDLNQFLSFRTTGGYRILFSPIRVKKEVKLPAGITCVNKAGKQITDRISFNTEGQYVAGTMLPKRDAQTIRIQSEAGSFYYITILPVTGRVKLYEKNVVP